LLAQRLALEVGKARNGQNVSHRAVVTNADTNTNHQKLLLASTMRFRGSAVRYFRRR
jgi:hypothetical protein